MPTPLPTFSACVPLEHNCYVNKLSDAACADAVTLSMTTVCSMQNMPKYMACRSHSFQAQARRKTRSQGQLPQECVRSKTASLARSHSHASSDIAISLR